MVFAMDVRDSHGDWIGPDNWTVGESGPNCASDFTSILQ